MTAQAPRPPGGTSTASLRFDRRELTLVAALFLAMLTSTFPEFVLGLVAPLLVEEFGIGEATIGVVAATMYLVAAIVARTAGRRLDEIGSRTALAVMYGTAIGALLLLVGSRNTLWLLVAGVFAGVALGINNPITSRFIVAAIRPGRRGLAIGIKQVGVKVGQSLAGAAIPWFSVSVGWRAGLAAVAAVALALLVGSLPLAPRAERATHAGSVTSVADARAQVRWLQLVAVALAVGQSAMTTYLALYGVQRLELSLTRAGLVVTTFALTATVARVVWVTVAERISHPSTALVLISGGAVVGLTLLVVAIPVPGAVWVAAVVTGLTVGSWNVVVQVAVLAEVEPSRTASATGAVQAAFMFGMAVGAPVYGVLVEFTGSFELAWGVTVVLAATAFATSLRQRQHVRRTPTPTPSKAAS